MQYPRLPLVLTLSGVCGGLFFTLASGLYTVRPLVLDAEFIYFGFPFTWFQAGRSLWMPRPPPWQYQFLWPGFVADFITFGLLTTAAVFFYFKRSTSPLLSRE